MGFAPDALEIVRRKRLEGKEPVKIEPDDPYFATFTGERTSLRTINRIKVAFLTRRQYLAWQRQRTTAREG